MAGRNKQKAMQQPQVKPRQVPKMKVIESGKAEQEAPIEAEGTARQPAKQAARAKERQEYRYGGIPIGSDPRE